MPKTIVFFSFSISQPFYLISMVIRRHQCRSSNSRQYPNGHSSTTTEHSRQTTSPRPLVLSYYRRETLSRRILLKLPKRPLIIRNQSSVNGTPVSRFYQTVIFFQEYFRICPKFVQISSIVNRVTSWTKVDLTKGDCQESGVKTKERNNSYLPSSCKNG